MGTPDEQGPSRPAAGPEGTKARLRRDLVDATSQLAATNEVLTALGRSVGTRVECSTPSSARRRAVPGRCVPAATWSRRTCPALRRAGGVFSQRWSTGSPLQPIAISRDSLSAGRASTAGPSRSRDVLADPGVRPAGPAAASAASAPWFGPDAGRRRRRRGAAAVAHRGRPLRRAGDRSCSRPFAAQAAIAVRQVGLHAHPGGAQAELASKVDQLEALSEVGEAVRSSLDLDEVLVTIVTNAVRLTGTDGGSLMEYDEAERRLPRALRLRQQPGPARPAAGRADRARHDARGPRGARAPSARGGRPRHRAAGPPPAGRCTTTAGGRCWRCRCCGTTRCSARW